MFAHKANPMYDDGSGIMAWTPFRERRPYGEMYWKVLTDAYLRVVDGLHQQAPFHPIP